MSVTKPRTCQICGELVSTVHNLDTDHIERRCGCGVTAVSFANFRARMQAGQPVFGRRK